MAMYFKDKSEICKIRVTQEQNEYLMRLSVSWGVSKSEVVRAIIDSYRKGESNNENK